MHLQVFRLLQRQSVLSAMTRVVLVTFLWPLISPILLAAQTSAPPSVPLLAPTRAEDAEFPALLAQMDTTLSRWQEQLERGEDTRLAAADLARFRQRLAQLETQTRRQFAHMAPHLQTQNLPQVIHQRHRDAVATTAATIATLRQQLDDLAAAATLQARRTKAAQAV